MKFSSFIGQRYATRARNDSLVGYISRLAQRGLILSVTVLVVVLAIINGFERELKEKILRLVPQVEISRLGGIPEIEKKITQLTLIPDVNAVLPYYRFEGLAQYQGRSEPLIVHGVELEREREIYDLDDYLVDGVLLANDHEIILGATLADRLGLKVGNQFILVVPQRGDSLPKFQAIKLVGLLKTGTELDRALAIMSLQSARLLVDRDHVDGLKLIVEDLFRADAIGYVASSTLGMSYTAKSWTRTYANLYYAIETSKQMIMLLLFLIIAIAVFNVVTTLIMVVVEKRADIAVFRTMGASRLQVLGALVWQGGFIGTRAAVIGILGGTVIAYSIPWFVSLLEGWTGVRLLDDAIYPVSFVPIEIAILDLMILFLVTVGISALASIGPALTTLKVKPAKALQHD